MQPPNASSDIPTQTTEEFGSLPETQAWETFLGGKLELDFFPERVKRSGSGSNQVSGEEVESGNAVSVGEGARNRVETTTPKQFSYFSGTTVEYTPGVFRDLFKESKEDGDREGKVREGGSAWEKGGMEGFDSSSPPPFSTLPSLSVYPIKQLTQITQNTQPATQFSTQPEETRAEDEIRSQQREADRNGELSPSLQPGSGLRDAWDRSSARIDIPDSDGFEVEEEQPVGFGIPVRGEAEGEEKVLDTPFVKLVAASVDGGNRFEKEEGGDFESTLLTTDPKESSNEIMGESHGLVISNISDESGQAYEAIEQSSEATHTADSKAYASDTIEESQEPIASDFSGLGGQKFEVTPQFFEATHATDTRENASETLRATQEPVISTFPDLSGQVPKVTPKSLQVMHMADSSKEGLSVIVCETLVLSPDQQHDKGLVASTSEADFESTQADELATLNIGQRYTPIVEKVIRKEELLHQGNVVSTLVSSEENNSTTDPSITMQLPIIVSFSDEDFASKESFNDKADHMPTTNTEAEKASSENHSSANTDPQQNDVISLEVESTKLTWGTPQIESSSGEFSLPATMLPPQEPLSSTDKGATTGDEESDGNIEVQVHRTEDTPCHATLLSRGNVALQNRLAELEDMEHEASTAEQQILKNETTLPDITLQPNEITVLEGLGLETGIEVLEKIHQVGVTKNNVINEYTSILREQSCATGGAVVNRDDLPVPSQDVEMDENEPTLPARMTWQTENVLEDKTSRFADDASHTTRRTEIPDSDISLEDDDSLIEDQNLAVRGTGDGVAGRLEMNDADKVMEESIDVATALNELENDGHNDQAIGSYMGALVDVPTFAGEYTVEANGESPIIPPHPKTTSQTGPSKLEKTKDPVDISELTGKIIDDNSPVSVFPHEATSVQLPTEILAQSEEELLQPAGLMPPENTNARHNEEELEPENAHMTPISLLVEGSKSPLPISKIFEPGTAKLQVQGSESMKARPSQGLTENPTTCKVIVIPASSESQFDYGPSSSSSSSNSIQQPSTVADIPPLAPPSPKAVNSKKRNSLAVEGLSSPVKADVPSSPPLKKRRVEDASPAKGKGDEEKSPVKDKDEVLMDELKAMKIASIQSRNSNLELDIQRVRERLEGIKKELKNPAAETVKQHIHLLHRYNDIRDVGQGLIGMIAENRGTRIGELYEEFGVGLKD